MEGSVYGVRVHGRLPEAFRPYLLPAGEAPDRSQAADDLRIDHRVVPALDPALGQVPPPAFEPPEVWASDTESGGRFAVHRLGRGFGLTVSDLGTGRFRCSAGAIEIEWHETGTGAPHFLFTYALPLWLETRGVPVLHGSAVTLNDRAVAFLGPSGTGKSVLCAALLARGCGFLADDGLALRRGEDGGWRCAAGPPLLRLWPSGIDRSGRALAAGGGEGAASLPRVHEALEKRRVDLGDGIAFGPGPGQGPGPPLAAVYRLHRRPEASGEVEVEDLGSRDGLVHLLEHGIAGAPAAALGLSARRLALLAELAEQIPVRRLSFPSAPDSADRILAAISI
jgi:hypothetical protein